MDRDEALKLLQVGTVNLRQVGKVHGMSFGFLDENGKYIVNPTHLPTVTHVSDVVGRITQDAFRHEVVTPRFLYDSVRQKGGGRRSPPVPSDRFR